jgi:hypothetical protein
MENKHIYLHEGDSWDNIRDILEENGINKNSKIFTVLHGASKKKYNNYIGYIKAYYKTCYYNFYIFPKIIPFESIPTDIDKQNYIYYLNNYFKLKSIYDIKLKRNGNLKFDYDFLYSSKSSNFSPDFFSNVITEQYIYALKKIEKLLNCIQTSQDVQEDVISQSIHGEINLRNNMLEFNKSLVHQTIKSTINDAFIVNFIYSKIQYFIDNFSDSISENVIVLANKIKRKIKSKYNCFSLDFYNKDILKYQKVFLQSKYTRDIYIMLIILLNNTSIFEHHNLEEIKEHLKIKRIKEITHEIFFNSSSIFEYFVYHNLIKEYGNENIQFKPHVFYTGKISGLTIQRKSEPDFWQTDINYDVLIDAKWKILDNNAPNRDDINKLWDDCEKFKLEYKKDFSPSFYYPIMNKERQRTDIYIEDDKKISLKFIDVLSPL